MNKYVPVQSLCGRFSRQQRLQRPEQFKRVFSDPIRVSDNTILLLARKNLRSDARLGLAIARKHNKRAVQRNRVKRIVRESFRTHAELLKGFDIVVTCRADVRRLSNDNIRQSLIKHWHTLGKK